MKEIKHGVYTYGIEEESGKTYVYHEDGEIKLRLPVIGLTDEIILVVLDVYTIAWNKGEEMGQWRAKKAIRDVLGI